jgi:hypothetical protein
MFDNSQVPNHLSSQGVDMIGSYEEKKILDVIDCKAWQHSWHLPKNEHGIDWSRRETIKECLDVATNYERQAIALAARCREAREVLERELKDKETSGNG